MKIKRGLKYTLLSGAAAVIVGLCVAAAGSDFALGRNIQILFNMFREIGIVYVDPVDTDKLLRDAAAGMVSGLDPYTVLIPEDEMSRFEILITGKYGGMGALVRKNGDYVEISQPYKGFPADKAGLVPGDRILDVDGVDVKGYDITKVSELLKGEPGTTLNIRVEKLLTGRAEELSFKRERIVISGISYYGVVGDRTGYIVHSDFSEDSGNDFRKAFLDLKGQGITSLIIDLRNNTGGIMQEAVKIMSMFVPKGTEVVSTRGRNQEQYLSYKTENDPLDTEIPVVVLVNGESASASEIVAGAFQDLDRGVLVGQRTFGKGLVQASRSLGYNAYLKITTAKYYIPSGRCIQAIDYAHRNEDGSLGYIPDSLITEFTTKNGRKVYDGAGVMPDIRMQAAPYPGGFTETLYSRGYIEDFANEYFKKNHGTPVNVDTFSLSDADYADFVKFMADKSVDFESGTSDALATLRRRAQQEKYIDRISTELDRIEAKIKGDKNTDLQLFRADISKIITDDIVMRFHYGEGVIRHNIRSDEDINAAVALLSDPARYRTIITSQDTARK